MSLAQQAPAQAQANSSSSSYGLRIGSQPLELPGSDSPYISIEAVLGGSFVYSIHIMRDDEEGVYDLASAVSGILTGLEGVTGKKAVDSEALT